MENKKIWIVEVSVGEYEDHFTKVVGVYDTEEKALKHKDEILSEYKLIGIHEELFEEMQDFDFSLEFDTQEEDDQAIIDKYGQKKFDLYRKIYMLREDEFNSVTIQKAELNKPITDWEVKYYNADFVDEE